MKSWDEMTNQNKVEAFNTYLLVENSLRNKYKDNQNYNNEVQNKIYASQNDSYRNYLILYLLDKNYTISDGFKFLNNGNFLVSETDMYSIIAEKLNMTFDQVLYLNFQNVNILENEKLEVTKEISKLTSDIKTRIEIFVEVHNMDYQKANPEKYIELLNSPITSLLSIKLSNNERLNNALKQRIMKARNKSSL